MVKRGYVSPANGIREACEADRWLAPGSRENANRLAAHRPVVLRLAVLVDVVTVAARILVILAAVDDGTRDQGAGCSSSKRAECRAAEWVTTECCAGKSADRGACGSAIDGALARARACAIRIVRGASGQRQCCWEYRQKCLFHRVLSSNGPAHSRAKAMSGPNRSESPAKL